MWLIGAGLLIITALSWYAGSLLARLKKQNAAIRQAEQERQQQEQKQLQSTLNSLMVISQAVTQGQCDISEGSWRVAVLIEAFNHQVVNQAKLNASAIFELYNGIKHMPIREQRKELDKKERMRFDMQRMKLEANLHDQVIAEMENLSIFTKDKISRLS